MMTHSQETLLRIVRSALWQENVPLEASAWDEIELLAEQQGVLWMLYPGAKKADCVPRETLMKWRNALLERIWNNEPVNAFQTKLLTQLAGKGIRAAILKGTSCSRYYAVPNMRPLGDIDLLVDYPNVDAVADLLREQGFEESKVQHSFHIGFSLKQITVEVHYRCTDLPQGKGTDAARNAESAFLDQVEWVGMNGMCFPVLSETHQALMLLMHMERHMQEDGIGLRQLCDWAVFVNGANSSHWEKTITLLKSCGLFQYAKVVTNACVKYLGLKSDHIAWLGVDEDPLSELLMQDAFRRGSFGQVDDQNVGSLFSDRSAMGMQKQSLCRGMIMKMKALAYRKYPYIKQHKWLLPILYFYIPFGYIIKSLFGRNTKRNLYTAIASARERQKLYHSLHLYEVRECTDDA